MPFELSTGRGIYLISLAAPFEYDSLSALLTLALTRADGIERLLIRCRVARSLIGGEPEPDKIIERFAPWLEREFEQTRETALKTIRSERRLLELIFDAADRGPF